MGESCVGTCGVGGLVADGDLPTVDGPAPPPRGAEAVVASPTAASGVQGPTGRSGDPAAAVPTARILPFRPRGQSVAADRPASASPCGDAADTVIARAEAACARYRKLAAEPGLSPAAASRRERLRRKMEDMLELLRTRRREAELRRGGGGGDGAVG